MSANKSSVELDSLRRDLDVAHGKIYAKNAALELVKTVLCSLYYWNYTLFSFLLEE